MPQTLRMHPGGSAPAEEQPTRSERVPPRGRRCPQCRQVYSSDGRFCPFDGTSLVDAPDWSPASDPLLGKTVDGRYEVLSLLGEGGMGTVYEVRHATLGRTFAMKVLRRDIARDADLVARFTQEAKAAAGLGHPNIVTVSDFGSLEVGPREPSRPYFVMELLEGMSLGQLLRAEKSAAPRRVAPLFIQCARGLEAAHQAGVVHRDLKPDNIFIIRRGEEELAKLLDFGVAKIAGTRRLTRLGMVFGTPHYMSPEQAEGKQVDSRTDIYALGVIMYECFSGKVPFEADTYMGVLTKHMFAVPEPIERVMPDASALGAFGPIVMRCLAKRPEERYPSMASLADALELALTDPKKAAAPGIMSERPRRAALQLRERDAMLGPVQVPDAARAPLSRKARVAIAVAALTVPIAAALGLRAWQEGGPPPEAGAPHQAAAPNLPAAAADHTPAGSTAAPDPPTEPAPGTSAAAAQPSLPGVRPASVPAQTSSASNPGTSRTSVPPPKTSKGGGDIVDPWQKK
ncbi:MAG TPA: protein kinase [Candidatus Nanopelagicales bacterium]|nr:protein kinase [Candidatus Nanopelagicales bacterium]